MFTVEYYSRPRGDCPVAEWLDDVARTDKNGAPKIDAMIERLHMDSTGLLSCGMMKPIKGADKDLYELRPKPYRVIVGRHTERSRFILLYGFRKQKQHRQTKDVERGRRYWREYLSRVN